MLRYIYISALLLFCLGFGKAQNNEELDKIDKLLNPVPKGFTLGVNLASPVNHFFDKDRTGVSFLTRINVTDKWFFVGEAGYENVSFKKDAYHYESNGTFIKAGAEIDMLSKKKSLRDNLMVGFQYGLAFQGQNASHFLVENGYWDDYQGRVSSETLNTHWLEISAGPRTEIFKNFFIGWKVHIRASFINGGQDLLKPYIVPGFGSGDNRVNGGFSYTLEYMIPLKK